MNTHRLRRLLWTLSALLALGGLLALPLALWWPFELPRAESIGTATSDRTPGTGAEMPAVETFAPLWATDYRRPLFDGPAAGARERPPLAAKLAGTVVEPGFSQAMFSLPGGEVQMHAVGGKIAGAEVLEIGPDSAVVLYEGERLTLKVSGGDQP